jgi:hypothetical protein
MVEQTKMVQQGGRGTALFMGILIASVGIAIQSWRLMALGAVLILVGGWFAFFSDFGR